MLPGMQGATNTNASVIALALLACAMQWQVAPCSSSSTVPPPYLSVVWDTPTPEPGLNTKNQPVISGGMPVGNGETAVAVFPIVPRAVAPVPPPPPTPGAGNCTGTLVDGKYCALGAYIGCHDSSCIIGDKAGSERACKAQPQTEAACALDAGKTCDATAGCVAFSLMHTTSGYVYELAHNTMRVLTPYPDTSWRYYVSAKPWPTPAGPGPAPAAHGCFGRTADDCFRLPNSLSFFVNMATAMASDTTLFKLGMVSLVTDPPLFDGNVTRFEQRLDMQTATVSVKATLQGGRTVSASVFVDANSNTISASLNSSSPVKLTVVVQSLHPNHKFTYAGGFGGPSPLSGPDVFEPDLPASLGRIVVSHRNEDSDQPAAFNYTLEQQGLGSLVDRLQSSDHWRHRQFGMALSGVAGTVPLKRLNASALQSAAAATSFEVTVSTHASQTPTRAVWLQQLQRQHDQAVGSAPTAGHIRAPDPARARPSELVSSGAKRAAEHGAWWQGFWARSHIAVSSSNSSTEALNAAKVTQAYAVCRYVQAIQARTWVPVKFNGQMFTANLPPETSNSGPSMRDWGANSWWQNTRLTYWPMAPAADFDTFATIIEFYLQTLPFNSARTEAYFNHSGIFYTETKTLFGAFAVNDYGSNASSRTPPKTLPPYLESNGYIHYDYGGNAGGTGVSMMILDHFLYTQNMTALQRYFPIVSLTLDFFRQHHKNRTTSGEMVIWPTQALETYWCAWQPYFDAANNKSNCIVNDHPTVAALHVLLERVLQLPSVVGTAAQRAEWAALQKILPPVPLTHENGFLTVSPYSSYPINNKIHNSETPELYSVHPFRYYSLGRQQLGAKRSLEPALNCLVQAGKIRRTCANAISNGGWNQGVMNAALLGNAFHAKRGVVGRALTAPGKGYRFLGFAPHEQDYEPSADQFANMNSGLNWMLAQPADDADGSVIILGAWPCSWDVDFKLAAPVATTIEGVFKGGKLLSLTVTPASRKAFVHVMACQHV